MRDFFKKLWISVGLKHFLPTFETWFEFAVDRFSVTNKELLNFVFDRQKLTLEQWAALTNELYGQDVDQFKAAAYNFRIKIEAAEADDMGIGDAYRWGSDTAKAEQEALADARAGRKRTEDGIMIIGKSLEERKHDRLMARDDLLIGNMVKKAATEAGVELAE